MPPPILSIIGKSKSGKTTLIEKIIQELKRRGYRVGTIKHHSHPGFEIDQPGKDTWRHAQAGSNHVVISAPDKIASIRTLEHELSLDEIAAGMQDVDIILTEGFKRAGMPAIEVVRSPRSQDLMGGLPHLIAVATNIHVQTDLPQFELDDAAGITDFIAGRFLQSP
jgi:molybdopterin-guanine dinucleotide biosynthesis protein MobB